MEISNFEKTILEKTKGSEFEFVLLKAQAGDEDAKALLKSKEFRRRLFVHMNKTGRKPQETLKIILFKAGTAIAIVLFERLLAHLFKKVK